MTFLNLFALIILVVLLVAIVAAVVILGMMPGQIAKRRNHPQAEAISVCGWWGVATMGILLPLAFIWAYTNAKGRAIGGSGRDCLFDALLWGGPGPAGEARRYSFYVVVENLAGSLVSTAAGCVVHSHAMGCAIGTGKCLSKCRRNHSECGW